MAMIGYRMPLVSGGECDYRFAFLFGALVRGDGWSCRNKLILALGFFSVLAFGTIAA